MRVLRKEERRNIKMITRKKKEKKKRSIKEKIHKDLKNGGVWGKEETPAKKDENKSFMINLILGSWGLG